MARRDLPFANLLGRKIVLTVSREKRRRFIVHKIAISAAAAVADIAWAARMAKNNDGPIPRPRLRRYEGEGNNTIRTRWSLLSRQRNIVEMEWKMHVSTFPYLGDSTVDWREREAVSERAVKAHKDGDGDGRPIRIGMNLHEEVNGDGSG